VAAAVAQACPRSAAPAALSGALAARLAEAGLRLGGVDGPSVDTGDDESLPAHHALLSRGVVIVEGLALAAVPPGRYHLVCLPLPLVGADSAPARAILMDEAEPEA
jgi:arylformamidase